LINIIPTLLSWLFIAILTYSINNFTKIKYSYSISISIIGIWSLTVLVYLTKQTDFNYFPIINAILTTVFLIDLNLFKRKISKVIFNIFIWLLTGLACLLCFSGFGALLLVFVQPICYLFLMSLLKNEKSNEKVITVLYLNLALTYGFLSLITIDQISKLLT